MSRLTIALEEPAAAAQLLSAPANAIAASHDILAVQPLSERVLQQVLLISFPLSVHIVKDEDLRSKGSGTSACKVSA